MGHHLPRRDDLPDGAQHQLRGRRPARRAGPVPEEPLRLFFAVSLPAEVRADLAALRPPPGTPGAGAYRWVAPDLLHVTLAFLGERPESDLPVLEDAARAAAATTPPFHLALGAPGAFGPRAAPRVLWVGLDSDVAHLSRLRDHLVAGLRAAGVWLEDRPFAPHVTLARRRPAAGADEVLAWPFRRAVPPPRRAFRVDGFALLHSDLRPEGPRYTPVAHFALLGSGGVDDRV